MATEEQIAAWRAEKDALISARTKLFTGRSVVRVQFAEGHAVEYGRMDINAISKRILELEELLQAVDSPEEVVKSYRITGTKGL